MMLGGPSIDGMSSPKLGVKAFVSGTFVLVAMVCWFATRAPGGPIDLFERGHWLGPASDMLAGKTPYRETFPVHGFLSDGGMDFLLFLLRGPSFSTSLNAHHLLGILFQPALFLVTVAATRRPGLAALAIPLNLGFATGIVADRPVLPLLGLASFLFALSSHRTRIPAFAAGFLAGIGFLYALDFGTFFLVGELAALSFCFLAGREASPIRASFYFLGLGLSLIPFLGYLAAAGALLPFLRTSFIDLPLHISGIWGWDFPSPIELGRAWRAGQPYFVGDLHIGLGIVKRLYLTVLLGTVGTALAVYLYRRYHSLALAGRLLALSLACLFSFRYVIARLHLEAGNALTGPLFFAIALVLYDLARRRARQKVWLAIAFGGICVVAAVAMNAPVRAARLMASAAQYGRRLSATAGLTPLSISRGDRVLVAREDATEVEALVHYFARNTPPDSFVLDLTNRPGLYFFLRRLNSTRFYQVPLMAPFEEEALEDLVRNPPEAVLMETGTAALDAPDGLPNAKRIPRVWQFVTVHYPERVRVGSTVVAVRTPTSRIREGGLTPGSTIRNSR